MHDTMIHDIKDLQKCLMQTWFDLEKDIIRPHRSTTYIDVAYC